MSTANGDGVTATVIKGESADTRSEAAFDTPTATQNLPQFIKPNFDRMPPELKILKNWVLWIPVWTGSKWSKRPIQTSGYGASSTKPKHWSSFENVKRAYEQAVACGTREP
jgi:hypothetical protein